MAHHGPLIGTIVVAIVLAFALGALAQRVRVAPIVGYLLAGVVVGPFTPGFVADQALAAELAEIGVILLMFGVGLHFSLKDLLSVKAIAIPGAVVQMAVATLLGLGLGRLAGWPWGEGLIFGLALSVASTVVLLKALQERRLIDTERGHIAVGWLIVEDLAMVLALVLLPAMAGAVGGTGVGADWGLAGALALTLGKVAAFVALMLLFGRRAVPWLLHYTAHTGSRELFRLGVLAVALGVAYGAAVLFDVSFALGAFFAGMILSESPLSQRAAQETLPLRDAFAVLFFVSVGMLFDPGFVLREPWLLLAALAIVVIGKSAAAFVIVRAFRHPAGTALTISASLAQIGEFSFILAGLGLALGMLSEVGRDLILAAAILSILVNPLLFAALDRFGPAEAAAAAPSGAAAAGDLPSTSLSGHSIVVGFGRVGGVLTPRLIERGDAVLVIEDRAEAVESARAAGAEAVVGNAADPRVLRAANLAGAKRLFVAIPEAFEAGQIVEQARRANPALLILARAHSDAEMQHLTRHGADVTIMGEREIAHGMLDAAWPRAGGGP